MMEAFWDRWGKAHYAEFETATKRTAFFAIIIKDEKVLLTCLPHHELFEFPGGGLNRGENFRTCLLRELYEETGYEYALDDSANKHQQLINFFADDIRPNGECWVYNQTYIVYDADAYGLEIKEGTWNTPENGTAKWVDLQDLKSGEIPLNYTHKLAFEALFLD